jgi:glycosyltransferase involved in cell wall biosynthesis
MFSRYTVSIILPVLNMECYLPSTLDALLCQQGITQDDEIIVVDNGSTDSSIDIAKSYQRVDLLFQPVRGSYAARNLGIQSSKGEIILFLDPDCRPRPNWLAGAITSFQDPNVEIVLGKRNYGRKNKQLSLLAAYENQKIQWALSQGIPSYIYGYTNNMAVRRSLFEKFGLFQERLRGGDTIFVQKIVHSLAPSVVKFNSGMEVDHLEITSLEHYYSKRAIYGNSNEHLAKEVPLSGAEKS